MAGAPKGSKNGQKLKTDDLQLEAYYDYCDWVASGKSKDSWRWRKDNRLMCTFETIEKYMKENPIKFEAIHMQIAKCDSKAYWEQIVADSATGENEKANTASLQMIMRNKFGWDKPQVEVENSKPHVVELAKEIRSGIVPEAKASDSDIEQ